MAAVQNLLVKVKPYVPVSVKRTVRRHVPARYYRYFDPEWHRRTIGYVEEWEQHGQAQFDYLKSKGLEPQHTFLDIGCGPLRGGIHFIRYLDAGNYYGVEKNAEVLETARDVSSFRGTAWSTNNRRCAPTRASTFRRSARTSISPGHSRSSPIFRSTASSAA